MDPNKRANIDILRGGEYGSIIAYTPKYIKKSRWQEIRIGENKALGKILILDGLIQVAEVDEYLYHELLVYPGMALTSAKRVLILGGGDGCAAREVLKHDVEKVVMVDIDKDVVEMSKEYFGDINKGSLEDKRLEVIIGDAKEYVKNTSEKFDLIISDVTDPDVIENYFYSEEYYKDCKRLLKEGGVFVTQAGAASHIEPTAKKIMNEVEKVFKNVALVMTPYIPSFLGQWGIVIASDISKVNEINDVKGIDNKYMNAKVYNGLVVLTDALFENIKGRIIYFDTYEVKWNDVRQFLDNRGRQLL